MLNLNQTNDLILLYGLVLAPIALVRAWNDRIGGMIAIAVCGVVIGAPALIMYLQGHRAWYGLLTAAYLFIVAVALRRQFYFFQHPPSSST